MEKNLWYGLTFLLVRDQALLLVRLVREQIILQIQMWFFRDLKQKNLYEKIFLQKNIIL